MSRRVVWWATVALFLGSIVAANAATQHWGLVRLPPTDLLVTAGTFFAAATFVIRDAIHEQRGRWWAVALIIVGGLLTVLISPALALASAIAFLVSELVDLGVYQQIREYSIPAAVLLSSLIAAPVDTVLFLRIAGFPLTWQAVLGQVIVKTLVAGVVVVILAVSHRRSESHV